MDRYAVIGNPIAHSKSPRIHALFARQTGQDMSYEAVLASRDGFDDTVRALVEAGYRGFNVTVPFKEDAFRLAAERSARAQRAGAVNTLAVRDDGGLFGDTTDGAGLLRDLTVNHGVEIAGRAVLVLGAGGAVRGVLEPLLAEGPASLTIANRTAEKAAQLARDFADLGVIEGGGFDLLTGRRFDLVVNGTAAGLSGELPPLPDNLLAAGAVCCDMMYGDEPTVFVRWAHGHGAALALDGLGMLVEQAAESFFLWRGLRPDTAPVIAALRP